MSAFKKFDPYAAASKPEGLATKVAKVPKVARPAGQPEVTLGGLGTLGGLRANIAKPISSSSCGRSDQIAYPIPSRVPADWIDGLERMRLKTCPIAVHPKHWLQLQDAARRFVELWGEQAAGLGWSALDVFGCHPERPSDRADCMGLVWMVTGADPKLMGRRIVALRTRSGRLITVSKSADVRERILIWGLASGGTDFSETTP
jgi:hypothetical protein